MGHGLGSTLLADLCIGAYRHARRQGAPVAAIHAAIGRALTSQYDDLSFATGIIGSPCGPGENSGVISVKL